MATKIISAGAGSGKTYRLMQELLALVKQGVDPTALIATTFTNKAAAELRERVMTELLKTGQHQAAALVYQAHIGTVHHIGHRLLSRFAYELGVSPALREIPDSEVQRYFKQAIAGLMNTDVVQRMRSLTRRLKLAPTGQDYDWQEDVRQIADAARSYNMSEEVLQKSRDHSINTLLALCPTAVADGDKLTHELVQAIETTLAARPPEDNTKATEQNVNKIQEIANHLNRYGELPWADWVAIAKAAQKVGKKSAVAFEPLITAALAVFQHPGLQQDLRDYIHAVFNLAIAAIEKYRSFKRRRGLLDLQDMETLLHELLHHPQVVETLQSEWQVLLVDEFQDTNPLQLAIFLRLTTIIPTAIWVGDPKQSIYGFRGADPRIMLAAIQSLGGIQDENILAFSWRSRPDIVNLTNAIFTRAFATMPAREVALTPKRTDDPRLSAALHHWHYTSDKRPNNEITAEIYADSVVRALASHFIVQDRHTDALRPALPGDICILCRTNRACESVAQALSMRGIRVAIARKGLFDTYEAALFKACLRYLYSDADKLAVAEIELLTTEPDRNHLLNKHLAQAAHPDMTRAPHPILDRLDALHTQLHTLTVSEICMRVAYDNDLYRIIAAWPDAKRRIENFDKLVALGHTYEDIAARTKRPMTLAGFLIWLDEQPGSATDAQSAAEDEHAVRILTYHKSKGLEFPIVILADLDSKIKDTLFGLSLDRANEAFDPEHPLENLLLRFWIQPFGAQKQGTPFDHDQVPPALRQAALQTALDEEARLLYVGVTRARDYLIVPTIDKRPPIWLNRVYNKGDETKQVLDPGIPESPFFWQNTQIPISTTPCTLDPVAPASQMAPQPTFYKPYTGTRTHKPFFAAQPPVTPLLQIKYTFELPAVPPGLTDWVAFKTWLCSIQSRTAEDRIITRLSAHDALTDHKDALLAYARRWQHLLANTLQWPTHIVRWPFEVTHNGQVWRTAIDIIGTGPNGYLGAALIVFGSPDEAIRHLSALHHHYEMPCLIIQPIEGQGLILG